MPSSLVAGVVGSLTAAVAYALLASSAGGGAPPNGVAAPGTRWLDLVHARAAWSGTRRDPAVVAVGATDFRGRRLPYSNFSPALDIAAPAASPSAGRRSRARYVPFSGTSAATPAVAGALGLLLSARPGLSAVGAVAALER